MEERRVISLKKDRVITLSKKITKEKGTVSENIKFIFTGLRWGKIYPTTIKKTYTGNWFQRLFRIGPCEVEKTVDTYGYGKSVDLDSSLVCYTKNKQIADIIYYGNRVNSYCKHYGDDVTGGGRKDVDNEIIRIDLDRVTSNVEYIAVILNSYSHDKFDEIPYVQMSIYGSDSRNAGKNKLETFAEYKIDNNPEFAGKEGLILGIFYRTGDSWSFKAIGTATEDKSIFSMAEKSVMKALMSI